MSSRERILDAAMEIFARYGYRRASMDLVAEAAGLTRQAVYHHFKSKEALFRAAVEALLDGALEAAAAAGAAAEQAGRSLADILVSQLDAKFRYIIECLRETSQLEELLSEKQHQAGDLNQRFQDKLVALQVATIERACKAQELTLRDRMTAADLARSIQFAIRGANDFEVELAAFDDVTRVVRLIVLGAVAPARLTSESRIKAGPPRQARRR
jgi:AcrR family transcriptional regulator